MNWPLNFKQKGEMTISVRDYNKQVAKCQRIRNTTLVVGVDVGNALSAVGFMNKQGKVLSSCAKVYNNREGFDQFVKENILGTLPIFIDNLKCFI